MLRLKGNITFVLIILTVLVSQTATGQRWKTMRYQVGGGAGFTQLFGDIGGSSDKTGPFSPKALRIDETNLAAGLYARYKINTLFSAKANLYYGKWSATDTGSYNDRGRSFNTTFYEFSGQFEYYILPEEASGRSAAMFNKKGMINNYATMSMHVFAGLGVTYSKSVHDTGYVFTQQDNYVENNVAPIASIGLGLKYIIDHRWSVEGELGYRLAFNDYLEGYHNTNSKFNDSYYFVLFSVNYRLKTSRRGIPAIIDKKHRY